MSCRASSVLIVFMILWGSIRSACADTYPLVNGETLEGDPVAFGRDGLAVKKPDGSYSEKIGWTNFTQTALKKLAALPKAQPFVEPYLEPDEPEASKKAAPEITLKPVPRLSRPNPRAGFGAIFSSPLTVTLLFILYLANLYAGYEVALFRNYAPGLVCAVAAVIPVLGPIIFLSMPTRIAVSEAEAAYQQPVEEVPAWAAAPDAAGAPVEGAAAAAPTATTAPRLPPPVVFQRGQTTFNRRFFETKLSGFLRVVPSEAEKDMVVRIRSARGEHTGQRITRIMPNELYLQISKAGASADVMIPFNDIQEVQIRHKDA